MKKMQYEKPTAEEIRFSLEEMLMAPGDGSGEVGGGGVTSGSGTGSWGPPTDTQSFNMDFQMHS